MIRGLLLCVFAGTLCAQSAADLLTDIDAAMDPVERSLPGSTKRAEAIAELVNEDLGLPALEVRHLRQALAEAWLDAGKIDRAQTVAAALVADAKAEAIEREAAALLWIGAWQEAAESSEKPDELPAPLAAAWPEGTAPIAVQVRALTAEAARDIRAERYDAALAHYDEALTLLVDQPAEARVPVYVLRLLAMELPEPDTEKIQTWLAAHVDDPALAQIASSALTAGQQLIGQPVPPWKAKRIDGVEGEFDLATLKGKVVLLDFFATWCQPCVAVAPVVAGVVRTYEPKGVVAIGVSLDTRDSAPQLPGFLARHGLAYPVVGELLGWDGELEDTFHVDGIPALIVVGADGRVAAIDLIGATPEETSRRVSAALDAALAAAAGKAPAPKPAGGAQAAPPVDGGLQGVLP